MPEAAYRAFFIPTRHEARGLLKHLKISSKTTQGRTQIYQAKNTLVVLTGIGQALAHQAATLVLNQYPLQELWILGVCGASQIGFEAGDAFLAEEIIHEKGGAFLKSHALLLAKAQTHFDQIPQRCFRGKILSVDRVIESSENKIFLGQKHESLGLEMEAYAIAHLAQQKRIPFIEIRWVLDPAEYNIPPTQGFVNPSGEAEALAALKTFAKNPALTFQMFPFVQKVQKAIKNMNQFLHSYFEDGRI